MIFLQDWFYRKRKRKVNTKPVPKAKSPGKIVAKLKDPITKVDIFTKSGSTDLEQKPICSRSSLMKPDHDQLLQDRKLDFLTNVVKVIINQKVYEAPRVLLMKSNTFKHVIDDKDFDGVIEISDKEASVTIEVLRHLFNEPIKDPVIALYGGIAHELDDLIIKCENMIISREIINAKNVCDLYRLPGLSENFKNYCKEFIVANYESVIPTDSWLDFNRENCKLVIELFRYMSTKNK